MTPLVGIAGVRGTFVRREGGGERKDFIGIHDH